MAERGNRRPPVTVNFAPVEAAALLVVKEHGELSAWMREVGMSPASGTDAVLAAAAAIAERSYATIEA